jgi:hypothetical protein
MWVHGIALPPLDVTTFFYCVWLFSERARKEVEVAGVVSLFHVCGIVNAVTS